jgi:hypothetical protein
VNNFAASALSGYEFSSYSEKDECHETFESGGCCLSRQRILRLGRIVSETITSGYKEFASVSGRANDRYPPPRVMSESVSEQPIATQVAAAYVGIDWADQKHDVVLRSVGDPAKSEHQIIKSEINALNDWIAQMHERFGAKGKVLVCLEQSRGALIYQLMAYELFELYPINPSQLAHYRKTFFSSGANLISPMQTCSVNW